MSFAPDMIEMLARARADLRMGVPVVLDGASPVVMFSVETLTRQALHKSWDKRRSGHPSHDGGDRE